LEPHPRIRERGRQVGGARENLGADHRTRPWPQRTSRRGASAAQVSGQDRREIERGLTVPAKPERATAPAAASRGAVAKTKEEDEADPIIASPEQAAALAIDDADDEFRRSLEKAIADNSTDAGSYVLLADLLVENNQFDQAEELLQCGLAATGKNLVIVERLEDLQIERASHQVAIAEKRAASRETDESQRLALEMRKELNRIELGVYRQRAERYPDDAECKYELGIRLKRAGNQEEAIQCFSQVGDQTPAAPVAALEMGESLQYLKHYHDALIQYERAARLAGENDLHHRKKALYRGAVLATGMRKLDKAEAMLRELESLDPSYKDLPARLDKIQKIRDSV
jgi:tetratricopeptide (TPR) repeat protein